MTINQGHRGWIFFPMLLVLGFGCSSTNVSDLTPEEAAASLDLTVGSEIVLRPTVLGLGGKIVDLFGGEADERTVQITQWTPGTSVSLSWTITTQTETAASVVAREAYEAEYGQTAVGEEVPDAPEPEYEDAMKTGTLSSSSLSNVQTLELPELWPEGEGGLSATSLIWMSRSSYDELVSTRSTTLSLGLFDESLMQVEEVTSTLAEYLEKVKDLWPGETTESDTSVETDTDDLLTIEAEQDWGEYTLLVEGTRTGVQTIEASNAFASYTILANPENPLILEIRLTPLSQGNLEVLSPSGFMEGFGGYEVSQMNDKTD